MGKISAKVFDLKGKKVGKLRLSPIFKTPARPDVIKRAVVAIQSHRFQPQGRDVFAGKRTTAESRGVGLGIARVARLKGRGQRAAFIPFAVGGRATHPPVVEKKIRKKIPRKEMRLALRLRRLTRLSFILECGQTPFEPRKAGKLGLVRERCAVER